MSKSLAIKYRPKTFDEVSEQSAIKMILEQQIKNREIKGAYCFVGAAGTGKTTCARIFANEINKGKGVPMELDAASHNGVDDVREIIKMSQTMPLDAEYKVFIIDECHLFSTGAWAAMLKLIEEPPAKCVFILCTTDYWKIPKTIQSRCQRYQFQRISTQGIVERLDHIVLSEDVDGAIDKDALEYIARLSDGCMREAIVTMEKCLAYNNDLTVANVVDALGLSDYDTFMDMTDRIFEQDRRGVISIIEREYSAGKDMKQFIKDYMHFILDVNKYILTESFDYIQLPATSDMKKWLEGSEDLDFFNDMLSSIMELDTALKWDSSPLYTIEAKMMLI